MCESVGGYTEFRKVTGEDIEVFEKIGLPVGVEYTPIEVATQVVAGTRYKFKCTSKAIAPKAEVKNVIIEALVHLDNSVELIAIIPEN